MLATLVAGVSVVSVRDYPNRPVRILTSTPGGGNDFLARIVAPALSDALGEQVIVDNRAGRIVEPLGANATSNGYSLVIGSGTSVRAADGICGI